MKPINKRVYILTKKALRELEGIVAKDLGQSGLKEPTKGFPEDLGVRLLRITSVLLKRRANKQRQK